MTPEQYIKKAIIQRVLQCIPDIPRYYQCDLNIPENIEKVYDNLDDEGYIQDARNEFREGQFETDIPCGFSRHYESTSVGAEIDDVVVGWTYWYGGGKHGEPESIDWMDESYFIKCVKEKTIVVKEYEKIKL